MMNPLIIAMPLLGAALPIVVTQLSSDEDLKAVGRSVVKYAIILPIVLVATVIALVRGFA